MKAVYENEHFILKLYDTVDDAQYQNEVRFFNAMVEMTRVENQLGNQLSHLSTTQFLPQQNGTVYVQMPNYVDYFDDILEYISGKIRVPERDEQIRLHFNQLLKFVVIVSGRHLHYHRDLKLENLLLHPANKTEIVVSDFGMMSTLQDIQTRVLDGQTTAVSQIMHVYNGATKNKFPLNWLDVTKFDRVEHLEELFYLNELFSVVCTMWVAFLGDFRIGESKLETTIIPGTKHTVTSLPGTTVTESMPLWNAVHHLVRSTDNKMLTTGTAGKYVNELFVVHTDADMTRLVTEPSLLPFPEFKTWMDTQHEDYTVQSLFLLCFRRLANEAAMRVFYPAS